MLVSWGCRCEMRVGSPSKEHEKPHRRKGSRNRFRPRPISQPLTALDPEAADLCQLLMLQPYSIRCKILFRTSEVPSCTPARRDRSAPPGNPPDNLITSQRLDRRRARLRRLGGEQLGHARRLQRRLPAAFTRAACSVICGRRLQVGLGLYQPEPHRLEMDLSARRAPPHTPPHNERRARHPYACSRCIRPLSSVGSAIL